MKIVHFIPLLTKGGAERVVIDLANEAERRGHEVSIVTWAPMPAELGAGLLNKGVEVRYLTHKLEPVWRAYTRILPWIVRNRTWLASRDILHCHLSMGSAFATMVQLLRQVFNRPQPRVIETYHAVGVAIPPFDRWMHGQLLRGRDAVAFMADDPYWARYRKQRSKLRSVTIANGVSEPAAVDVGAGEAYRRKCNIPDGAFVIGSVGRLVPERRPDLLLEVFHHLTQLTDRNIHLLLAGEGPDRSRLHAEAGRLGLADRVHLPGLILNPSEAFEVIHYYLTVNVGPITGIAALEAAFAGLPIAAIQLSQSEPASSENWIWSSPDPKELATYVAQMIDSPAAMAALAEKQHQHVTAHHSVEAMANAYERLYEDAIRGHQSARSPISYQERECRSSTRT